MITLRIPHGPMQIDESILDLGLPLAALLPLNHLRNRDTYSQLPEGEDMDAKIYYICLF